MGVDRTSASSRCRSAHIMVFSRFGFISHLAGYQRIMFAAAIKLFGVKRSGMGNWWHAFLERHDRGDFDAVEGIIVNCASPFHCSGNAVAPVPSLLVAPRFFASIAPGRVRLILHLFGVAVLLAGYSGAA